MSKKFKKLVAIGTGMVLAGIMVCIISGIFGGTLGAYHINTRGWNFIPFSRVPFVTEFLEEDTISTEIIQDGAQQEYCSTDSNTIQISRENVRSVELKAEGCVVEILPGNPDQNHAVLEYSRELSHKNIQEKFDEKEGKWEIEIHAKKHRQDNPTNTIQLVLPPDLIEFSTEVSMGEMEMKGISANKIDINANMSDVTFEGISANKSHIETNMGNIEGTATLNGKVEIDCSMGDVQLNVANKTEYGYKIENEMGTVTIDERKYEGVLKDVKINTQAPLLFDVDCSMGDVTIEF